MTCRQRSTFDSPPKNLKSVSGGGCRGGRLYFLAAEQDAEKPNIKACDYLVGLD